jgi:hypothetical protein
MRLAATLLLLAVAAVSVAGCGSSDGASSGGSGGTGGATSTAPGGATATACALDADGIEGLRVAKASCAEARRVARGWRAAESCSPQGSRAACSVESYRCLATASDRGWSVSCAEPGKAIAFTVRGG